MVICAELCNILKHALNVLKKIKEVWILGQTIVEAECGQV
jgi:hypothetical protein